MKRVQILFVEPIDYFVHNLYHVKKYGIYGYADRSVLIYILKRIEFYLWSQLKYWLVK